jgi:hypothetical protein
LNITKNYRLVTLLYLLALFTAFQEVTAQQVTLSGKLIDSEDGEPLPFATIGIEGTSIGVISNTQGAFDFHFDSQLLSGRLVIRTLGYQDHIQSISELNLDQITTFQMEKISIQLEEIVFVDSLTGGDILKIALERVTSNYPSEPYTMDGFYRDLKIVDNTYVSLLEAACNIYDKDYAVPRNPLKLRERVGLVEVRKSLNYEAQYLEYFDHYNQLEEMLLQNNIKYRDFSDKKAFYDNIIRRDAVGMGEKSFYELSLTGDNDYSLTVFIDAETYGIQKMLFHRGDMTRPLQEIIRSGKRTERIMRIEKEIEFKEFNGKLFLKYMKVTTFYSWRSRVSDEIVAQTQLQQFLVINKVDTQDPEWIPTSKKMKKYGLQFQDLPYNKSFWDNYNLLKDTPLDKQIVKDLERYGTLNEQFQY